MHELERPFEILKLIRDGAVTNLREFREIPRSRFYHYIRHFMSGLADLGFVELSDEMAIKPTPLLSQFLSTFDLSLTHLADYTPGTVLCQPEFGPPREPEVKSDVFVLMPFTDALQPVYTDHIQKVVADLNMTVARADDFFTADSIISDIWNAISDARIVVADCTGRNPNVFYEIGISHTLGKRVILMAQSTDDVPFDLRHIRTIIYQYTPRGMEAFEKSLRDTLETVKDYPTCLADWLQYYR